MPITVKLYAGLTRYLPDGASNNAVQMDLADGTTAATVIDCFDLPEELVHIVLLNGVYIQPEDRAGTVLKDGDVLALWPPVAGG